METKLKEYRQRKARQESFRKVGTNISKFFSGMIPGSISEKKDDIKKQDDVACEIISETSDSLSQSTLHDDELCDSNTWAKVTLYGSLWLFLFILAIHVEFGAVYFVISLLYIIWHNTRTGPKKAGEVSAYSVFNPNCEAIEGTLDAEQFDKEIRYGGLR